MYRSTGCVIIHDEYVVIVAQALRKCGYPRWINGHRCRGGGGLRAPRSGLGLRAVA